MGRTVYIARHGERIDHVDTAWKSKADLPDDPFLTRRGLGQAKDLAERLRGCDIKFIFTSPFYRCIQTANALAQILDLSVKIEPGAGEFLHRDWFDTCPKLRSLDVLQEDFKIDVAYQSFWEMKYPERKQDVGYRAEQTIGHLVDKYLEFGNILIVSHGYVVERLAKGLDPDTQIKWVTYCSLVEVTQVGDTDSRKFQVGANADESFLSQPGRQVEFIEDSS